MFVLKQANIARRAQMTTVNLLLVSLSHLLHNSKEKLFSSYILLNDQISLSDFIVIYKILSGTCIVIFCFPVDDIINFISNVSIPIKPFSYMTKKFRTKF